MTPTRGVDPERPVCPNCRQTQVPAGHLCCAPCWKQVPPALQRGVMLSLRQWRNDPTDDHWFAYVDKREAALTALKESTS